jgi:hypothetical protein
MFLRDPVETALNEVLVACEAAAEEHAYAAGLLGQGPCADLLHQASVRRREAATVLMEEIRRLGDLPRTPDRDRESLHEGYLQVKAALAGDEARVLGRDRAAAESRLRDLCNAALETNLPPRARKRIETLRADADETEQTLRDLACSG